MNKDFLIKSRNGAIGSLTIALVYVIFIVLTLLTGTNIAKSYGVVEYTFLVIAVVVVALDVIDLVKMKNEQLKVSFTETGVSITSYWFSKKEYEYALMEDIVLTEKDICFQYQDKKRYIGFLSKSDLIRAMKILKDNCEK